MSKIAAQWFTQTLVCVCATYSTSESVSAKQKQNLPSCEKRIPWIWHWPHTCAFLSDGRGEPGTSFCRNLKTMTSCHVSCVRRTYCKTFAINVPSFPPCHCLTFMEVKPKFNTCSSIVVLTVNTHSSHGLAATHVNRGQRNQCDQLRFKCARRWGDSIKHMQHLYGLTWKQT